MSRKVFVLALAALLTVAFAATAIAETKVSMSGLYRVRGFYKNNFNLADESDNESKSSYFDQRFRLKVDIMPADNLSVTLKTQALKDNKWGTQSSKLNWANSVGALGNGAGDAEYNSSFEVYEVYMTIKSAYGQFRLGRQESFTYGLQSIGYAEGDRCPFDGADELNAIRYDYASDNLNVRGWYGKVAEIDQSSVEQDGDYDQFGVEPTFKFANGAAGVAVIYDRDHTGGFKFDSYTINPALRLMFGAFQVNAEMAWLTGKEDVTDVDLEGMGFYLDGSWTYGPGQIGAYYIYTQGDDDATDNKAKGLVTTGGDFLPLFLIYDQSVAGLCDASNHWTFGLWWNHNITEDLMLKAAYGYVKINEVPNGFDDNYGSEFDFGLSYKIMANLTYSAIFGYFMPGDFIKDAMGVNDIGNAYAFKHQLQMNF